MRHRQIWCLRRAGFLVCGRFLALVGHLTEAGSEFSVVL